MAFNNNSVESTQPSRQGTAAARGVNRRKPVTRGKIGVAFILLLIAAGIWAVAALLGFSWVGSSWASAGNSMLSFWGGALVIPLLFWLYLCTAWLMRLRPPRLRRQLIGTVLLYISMSFMLGLARSTGWNPSVNIFEPGRFGMGTAGFFMLNLGVPGAVISAVILLTLSSFMFGSRIMDAILRFISSDDASDDDESQEEPSSGTAEIPIARRRRSMPHGRLVVPPDFDDYNMENMGSYTSPEPADAAVQNTDAEPYSTEYSVHNDAEPQFDGGAVYNTSAVNDTDKSEKDSYADDYEDHLRELHANDYYVAVPGVNVRLDKKKQQDDSLSDDAKKNLDEKTETAQDEAPAVDFRIGRFVRGGDLASHKPSENAAAPISFEPSMEKGDDDSIHEHESAVFKEHDPSPDKSVNLSADTGDKASLSPSAAETVTDTSDEKTVGETDAGRSTVEILDGILASLKSITPPHTAEHSDDGVRYVRRTPRRPAVDGADAAVTGLAADRRGDYAEHVSAAAPRDESAQRNDKADGGNILIEYESGGVWTDIRDRTASSSERDAELNADNDAPRYDSGLESGVHEEALPYQRSANDDADDDVSIAARFGDKKDINTVSGDRTRRISIASSRSSSDDTHDDKDADVCGSDGNAVSAAGHSGSADISGDISALTDTLRRVSDNISSEIMSAAEVSQAADDNDNIDEMQHIRKGAFPPPIDIFGPPSEAEDDSETRRIAEEQAETIVSTLKDFAVTASVAHIVVGPSVIQFQLELAPGTRVNKVSQLANDLMMALAVISVRIEAPILGQRYVGVEIPNVRRRGIPLRDAMEAPEFAESEFSMPLPMGMKVDSSYLVCGLEEMPHLLVAGTTGSGKSVFVNSCILGMCSRKTPDELKLILVDPKRVEFAVYDGLPHLLARPVSDPRKAIDALTWAVQEMERRGETFERAKVRNLASYNQKVLPKDRYPNIVVIVDELADLMYTAGKEVESLIARLAQKARAAGIHLILATQRPSVDVVTGLIKANVPARVAFAVPSLVDSRTIIDTGGADTLLGKGDMLFLSTRYPRPLRLQAPFISEERTIEFVEYMKDVFGEPEYVEFEDSSGGGSSDGGGGGNSAVFDPKMEEAIRLIMDTGITSASGLQRYLSIGYPKAGRIITTLEQLGILGPQTPNSTKPRDILMDDMSAMDALERARNGGAFDD